MPTIPENTPASVVNRALAAMVEYLRRLGETAARAQWPFLNWPIVSQVFSWILGQLSARATYELQTAGTFAVIEFQTRSERDNYLRALTDLEEAKKKGDNDAREKALEKVRKSFDDFVRYNGRVSR